MSSAYLTRDATQILCLGHYCSQLQVHPAFSGVLHKSLFSLHSPAHREMVGIHTGRSLLTAVFGRPLLIVHAPKFEHCRSSQVSII